MPHPTLTPVNSSMASHAHYDPAVQAFHVTFSNGSKFRYDGVPHNIGETVMGAASFGSSFNRHIAGKYAGAKI